MQQARGVGRQREKLQVSALDDDDADPALLTLAVRRQLYDYYLTEANRWVERLKDEPAESPATLKGELGDLQFLQRIRCKNSLWIPRSMTTTLTQRC